MTFASYKEQKQMKHLYSVRNDFYAGVIYEDDVLETKNFSKTTINWQHQYKNDLTILALLSPYYSDFNFRFHNFKFENGFW